VNKEGRVWNEVFLLLVLGVGYYLLQAFVG